jgi:pilus assembly protein CpaE
MSVRIRELVLREGHDCPAALVHSINLVGNRLAVDKPDLLVLVLSPNVERVLTVLKDVRGQTTARILAVGPAQDPKVILQALRDGADQYLDEADLDQELQNALARLRPEPGVQAEAGKLIAVLGPNGGCGSSTVAANLAVLLAKQYKTCALFDLKLEACDLEAFLNVKPNHTLADLCTYSARMDRTMLERSLVRHSSGVCLLAPPRTLADVSVVKPEGVRQALVLARSLFPFVIADLDHSYREEQNLTLGMAEVVLLVMRLDFASLRTMKRTIEHLQERLQIPRNRLRLVVNRHGQPNELAAAKAEEILGLKISHYLPEDAKAVNAALNVGVPVVLEKPSAKVSKMLAKLAVSLNGRK